LTGLNILICFFLFASITNIIITLLVCFTGLSWPRS